MNKTENYKDREHYIPHLRSALQLAGINISTAQAEKVVKIVQLVKENGGDVTINQILDCVDSVK